LHPRFAPVAAECPGHGPGVGNPVPPSGMIREGEGASQVPGEPLRTCPVLRPRRDRRRQAIAAPRRGLPLCGRRLLPRRCRFRGSIARPVHSLSTLRSPGRPGATQDSFPAAGPALPGGVGYPQGSSERFLRFGFLLSQAFLAHPLLDSTQWRKNQRTWSEAPVPPRFAFSKPISEGLNREIVFENGYRESRILRIPRTRRESLADLDNHRLQERL
jgi:hypothetical protein